jgi:hypothetical protein
MKVIEDYVVFNNPNSDFIRLKVVKEDSPAFDLLFEIKGISVEETELDENGNVPITIDFDLIDESTDTVLEYQIPQKVLDDLGECVVSLLENALDQHKLTIEEENRKYEQQQSEERVSSVSDSSESGSE